MKIVWTEHLKDPEEKSKAASSIRASKTLINRFIEILQKEKEELQRRRVSSKEYDNPNWAIKQADFNAEERHINKMLDLFDFTNDTGRPS